VLDTAVEVFRRGNPRPELSSLIPDAYHQNGGSTHSARVNRLHRIVIPVSRHNRITLGGEDPRWVVAPRSRRMKALEGSMPSSL
jgi:hypothetical protein